MQQSLLTRKSRTGVFQPVQIPLLKAGNRVLRSASRYYFPAESRNEEGRVAKVGNVVIKSQSPICSQMGEALAMVLGWGALLGLRMAEKVPNSSKRTF